jgi:hypothetical protein
VPQIILDFDPEQPDAPGFENDTSDLVFFLSWAFATRYGASHELSEAAIILRNEHKIDLAPLLTFADRDIETPEDEDVMERSWQEAALLAACCDAAADGLGRADDRLDSLREDYPSLVPAIRVLGHIAAWASERGARIRVTYSMED